MILLVRAITPLALTANDRPTPQPEFMEGELEYSAEEIVAEWTVQVGRGRRREFLVK